VNFNHVKLPELQFDLRAETTEAGRRYFTPEGNAYPSITTVLANYGKKAIMEWRQRVGEEEARKVSAKASGRGTKLHDACEKYLLNEMTDMKMKMMMPDVKDFFRQLKPHLDENIGLIYGLEQSLYSDRLRLAGRCDAIAEWNGELSIIDYKTSSKLKQEDWIQNYFMQCSAYAEMFEERTKMPINQIVVAIANDEGEPQIFVKQKHKYLDSLSQYIERYWNENTSGSPIDVASDGSISRN
jgi:hypothetical protein